MNDQQQKEAQKLLDEYVSHCLSWHGRTLYDSEEKRALKKNKCNTERRKDFFAGTCCDEHIAAGRKFKNFKERFKKIWPAGFEKNFPHSYGQLGFFQEFVNNFDLRVDSNEIGLIWVQSGPWPGPTSPDQVWNTKSNVPKYPD